MKKFLIAGAAAAIATAAYAQASQPAPQSAPKAGQHRQPGFMNKTETRADVTAHVQKMFAKLDTNHDGFITKDELNAIETSREQKVEQRAQRFDPSKVFDRLDTNHDGKITVAEADAARSQRAQAKGGQAAQAHATAFQGLFARADANKDNVLTRAEFDAMGEQLKARVEHASVARGGMATRRFDQSDANKDGRVTLAEMQQAALAQFDRADLNHDGTITPQERQQERQLMKSQRQPAPAPAKH
jgi:Ca2+-binding EF-hand superfamily protein